MARVPVTLKCFLAAMAVTTILTFRPLARAQNAPPSGANDNQGTASWHVKPEPNDYWKSAANVPEKPRNTSGGAAPKHDLSGVWDPGEAGLGIMGAAAMPVNGKPAHVIPFTAAGLEAFNQNKSASAETVLPTEHNDPVFTCEPQGIPREDLYEQRTTQIYQTPLKIIMLYTYNRVWRVIWLDGRELPKDPEPRWYGYSVGKWVDDTTLVVETTGMDERTWIDRAGRPHSADLQVEERFHRVDLDHMEWSMTITDPKMYTKPWVALDKMHYELQPDDFDVREMICSPSEFRQYNEGVGGPASTK